MISLCNSNPKERNRNMPKVSQFYIEQKRQLIVDAAFNVCQRKTVCTVTMQDIINESGLSQGGIYRFYSNIDEILADVLDKIRKDASVNDKIDEIFSKYHGSNEMYHQLFLFMASSMKKNLYPYYKIELEYYILVTNFPERAKRIYTRKQYPFFFKHMIDLLVPYLSEEIKEGRIHPIITLKEFFDYACSTYDGILKRALATNGYEENVKGNKEYVYDFDELFHTMYLASCYLLGIEI